MFGNTIGPGENAIVLVLHLPILGPTTLPALRALLSRVRRDGFAKEDGTVTPDFASVAAPVLDHVGHPVAGIAVTYPSAEVSEDQREAIVEQVIRTARDLTRRIGGS